MCALLVAASTRSNAMLLNSMSLLSIRCRVDRQKVILAMKLDSMSCEIKERDIRVRRVSCKVFKRFFEILLGHVLLEDDVEAD